MSWIEETPIAHRGLHGDEAPENTVAAFQRAIEAGYAIEIDVRLSADGVPIVFHDASLERLTGHEDHVHEVDWSRLGDLRLLDTSHQIPSLSQVLDLVDGQVPLLVELKNHGRPGRLETQVHEQLDGYDGQAAVQSFNPRSMRWYKRNAPELARGQVAGRFRGVPLEKYKLFLLERLMLNGFSRPNFVAYEHSALPYWPVTLHRWLGIPVLAWTVRSEDEQERIEDHVDNVIFEGYRP